MQKDNRAERDGLSRHNAWLSVEPLLHSSIHPPTRSGETLTRSSPRPMGAWLREGRSLTLFSMAEWNTRTQCRIYFIHLNLWHGNHHYALPDFYPPWWMLMSSSGLSLCCVCITKMRSTSPYWFLPLKYLGLCDYNVVLFQWRQACFSENHCTEFLKMWPF